MPRLEKGARAHFVGIGGAGLSAIASILLERGCQVSGSDMTASPVTAALQAAGATVFAGHDARYADGADMLLATSAVADDHVELAAARAQGIPVYRRREFMPILLRDRDTLAVAGAHGKTTTTSMIIHALQSAGQAPGFIVGGAMGNSGLNAGSGADPAFVIEADEYGNMFHGLTPRIAVVTTVEHDHPDFFATAEAMTAAFKQFVASIRPGGLLVFCADDEAALDIAKEYQERGGAIRAYGIENPAADWRASDIRYEEELMTFTVWHGDTALGEASLGVPGAHNVLNALAAMAVAHELGIAFESSAKALAGYRPTARRFELRGCRDGVIVIDDYAHHPTEIAVTITAARARYPGHAIWAIWQPHTYSRVRLFRGEFIAALQAADHVLLTPIYAAREAPLKGVSSQALAAEIPSASCVSSFEQAAATLRELATGPAVLLIFSAGDANRIADMYLDAEA